MLDAVGKPRSLKVHVPERPGQVDRHIGSTEKIERLTGWRRGRRSRRGSSAPSPGTARTRPGGGGISARDDKRLLVLGAGPAQLGSCPAAREPASSSSPSDRDPARRASVRGPARDRLGRGRARARRGLPRRGASTGSSRPGSTGRSGSRRASPSGSPAAPDRRRDRDARDLEAARSASASRPRRAAAALRARQRPRAAGRPVRRQGSRPAGPARARRSCATPDELADAASAALAASRSARALVEELVDGPEVTVNAFSIDGRFHPLTVTDRLTADPPRSASRSRTRGRAATPASGDAVDRAAAARPRRSASATARPTRRSGWAGRRPARDRARRAARRRSRRRALPGRARRRPERARARFRARRAVGRTPRPALVGGAASASSSRPRARCAASAALEEARAPRASTSVTSTASRATLRPAAARRRPRRRGARRRRQPRRRARPGSPCRRRSYASRSSMPSASSRRKTRLPAAGDRRGGDRGRRGDPALRLADHRPARRGARAADGRVPRGRARARRRLRHRALHLALVALGVGPGDEVITTPITWPATANVIVHTGATPVFVDVRDGDLNIDPERVGSRGHRADEGDPARPPRRPAVRPRSDPGARAARWSRTPRTRPRRATAAARSAGSPTRPASRSTRRRTSPPARAGSSRRTDDDVADAIRDLRLMRRGDGSLYDLTVPGYKANLSDVLAAIALVQLDKLERHAEIRRRQFALYDEAVAALDGVEPLARDPRDTHALHLYVVRIDPERAGATRDEYSARSRRRGSRRASTSCPCTADLVPRALPRPAAASGRRAGAATRSSRCRSRPRTRRRHRGRDRRRSPRPRAAHR